MMRIRFCVELLPSAGDRPYVSTILSVIYPDQMPAALAIAGARAEFAKLFGKDAFEIPGVHLG